MLYNKGKSPKDIRGFHLNITMIRFVHDVAGRVLLQRLETQESYINKEIVRKEIGRFQEAEFSNERFLWLINR